MSIIFACPDCVVSKCDVLDSVARDRDHASAEQVKDLTKKLADAASREATLIADAQSQTAMFEKEVGVDHARAWLLYTQQPSSVYCVEVYQSDCLSYRARVPLCLCTGVGHVARSGGCGATTHLSFPPFHPCWRNICVMCCRSSDRSCMRASRALRGKWQRRKRSRLLRCLH